MVVERLAEPGDEVWRRYSADHLARYHFAIDYARGKAVLDAGTGIGYGAAILKESNADRVDAVDIDESTVKQAREQFSQVGVNYAVSDCETLDSTAPPYDLVCSFENIEHLKNPEAFLRSTVRVLAPDGVLLCSTPDRAIKPYVDGRPANPYHVQEWDREEFRTLLSTYFGKVDLMVQVRSHWLRRREETVGYLQQAIDLSETTVSGLARRLVAKMGRVLLQRRPRIDPWRFGGLQGLATASPADFPIVPESLVSLYGTSFCHVAVCRNLVNPA